MYFIILLADKLAANEQCKDLTKIYFKGIKYLQMFLKFDPCENPKTEPHNFLIVANRTMFGCNYMFVGPNT